MSTLDVHRGALRAAVARFHVVRELQRDPELPARAAHRGDRAAAGRGARRSAARAPRSRPTASCSARRCSASSLPALAGYRRARPPERACSGPNLLAALAVLGAAPAPLARCDRTRVHRARRASRWRCATACSSYFGDAARPHAKWLSLASVLADPSSAGASYVDVRLPERPAAGFPAGVTPPARRSGEARTAGDAGIDRLEPLGPTVGRARRGASTQRRQLGRRRRRRSPTANRRARPRRSAPKRRPPARAAESQSASGPRSVQRARSEAAADEAEPLTTSSTSASRLSSEGNPQAVVESSRDLQRIVARLASCR